MKKLLDIEVDGRSSALPSVRFPSSSWQLTHMYIIGVQHLQLPPHFLQIVLLGLCQQNLFDFPLPPFEHLVGLLGLLVLLPGLQVLAVAPDLYAVLPLFLLLLVLVGSGGVDFIQLLPGRRKGQLVDNPLVLHGFDGQLQMLLVFQHFVLLVSLVHELQLFLLVELEEVDLGFLRLPVVLADRLLSVVEVAEFALVLLVGQGKLFLELLYAVGGSPHLEVGRSRTLLREHEGGFQVALGHTVIQIIFMMQSEEESKNKFIALMASLIHHITEDQSHQQTIYDCLNIQEINRLFESLHDTSPVLRKKAAHFVCRLLYGNQKIIQSLILRQNCQVHSSIPTKPEPFIVTGLSYYQLSPKNLMKISKLIKRLKNRKNALCWAISIKSLVVEYVDQEKELDLDPDLHIIGIFKEDGTLNKRYSIRSIRENEEQKKPQGGKLRFTK